LKPALPLNVLHESFWKGKELMPNAFTKQTAARALVRASPAPLKSTRIFVILSERLILSNWAWKVSHSLTNPLKGGRAIWILPLSRKKRCPGHSFDKSPYSSIFLVWVEYTREPAPRKSRDLNTAWLIVWYRPAINPKAARSGCPEAIKIIETPTPIRIIPIFSTL